MRHHLIVALRTGQHAAVVYHYDAGHCEDRYDPDRREAPYCAVTDLRLEGDARPLAAHPVDARLALLQELRRDHWPAMMRHAEAAEERDWQRRCALVTA